ncbi:uncharacterized protein [Typha angustifolia]|uniref:uncharacterized protein isoform X1 n=1 Tax=Typha angustifolia TaxID=59011 RepID=UPI003C2B559D
MAFRTPVAVVQNENLHMHRGKGVDGIKADLPKPAKTGRQERKALRDLSNTGKPPVSGATKDSALKGKSLVYGREAIKNVPKHSFLTDEEIKRCQEWAKEGIEQAHFTGNDMQNLQKDQMEKRIKKKVNKVMSALHEWSSTIYDLGYRVEEAAKDFEDIKMELEPEVLQMPKALSGSNDRQIDDLIDAELHEFQLLEHPVDFKLKDDVSADGVAD